MNARSEFGARLKQARDARGLSLRDIAATTKISAAALDALERGDASKLPGGIYSRAFVRSYAAEVGLEPDGTVREFLELFPSDTNPISNPTPASAATDATRDRHLGRVLSGAFVLAAGATAFVLMGWVSADWLRFDRPATEAAAAPTLPPPSPSQPVTVAPPAPAPDAPSGAEPVGTLAAEPAGTTAAEPAPAVHDVAQVLQADMLRLVVHPTDRCWVHIVADGSVVFSREMSAGESEVSEARDRFVITVGNAGAFSYTINDVPGRPLGGDGKVVKVRIDRASLSEFVAD